MIGVLCDASVICVMRVLRDAGGICAMKSVI
jgi:hypothetical protein